MKKIYEQKLRQVAYQLKKVHDYLNNGKVSINSNLEKYIQFLIAEYNILIDNLYNVNENEVEKIPLIKL